MTMEVNKAEAYNMQSSNVPLGSKTLYSVMSMAFLLRLFVLISLICRTCVGADNTLAHSDKSLVLFISFDGFRYDYLTRTDTPNFDKLIQSGAQAEYIYDAFVTKTFPNHYTMVTGLHEESHGIVGNKFYDPNLDEEFIIGTNSSSKSVWWDGGEPVWVTNQIQGGRSGAVNYVGSDVKIRGMYPTYHEAKYNDSIPFNERVDRIVSLFANDSINLGLLYFNEPDHSGHSFGPESPLMLPVIKRCDRTVGHLIDQLKKNDLYDKVDIVISSDHGMAEVTKDKIVYLGDYINLTCCRILDNNPIVHIWPNNAVDETMSIYHSLKNAHPNLTVYLLDDIPKQYHYHDNTRIPPIFAVVDENWQLYQTASEDHTLKGEHGYNNSLMSMHPFFIAHGPAFKEDYKMQPFRNVDIYPLLCHLLGIEPSPNNGSLDEVKMMLKEGEGVVTSTAAPGETTMTASQTTEASHHHKVVPFTPVDVRIKTNLSIHALIGLGVACFIALIATFLLVAMCIKQRTYRQPAYEYMPIEDTSIEGQAALQGPHASYFYPNTKI